MSEDKSYEKVKSPATNKKSPKKAAEKSEEASAAERPCGQTAGQPVGIRHTSLDPDVSLPSLPVLRSGEPRRNP